MIRPPPGNRARGAGGGLRVRLRRAVVVRGGEFASGKRGERGGVINHLEKRHRRILESPLLPERPRLTGASGARVLSLLQTCELLAGPRRRRDFAGPDSSGGGGRAAAQPRGVCGAEPACSPG